MKSESTAKMTICAIMAALMCILGPQSIPIGLVPVSFTNLVIYLAVYLIGMKSGLVSYIIYLLLGLAGLPVFSAFSGGLGKLAGPTGGYLIGFIFLAAISGFVMEKYNRKPIPTYIGMVIGTLAAYIFGTVWFIIQTKCDIGYALATCVYPFIPFDLMKIAIAILLGKAIRLGLIKSHLIEN